MISQYRVRDSRYQASVVTIQAGVVTNASLKLATLLCILAIVRLDVTKRRRERHSAVPGEPRGATSVFHYSLGSGHIHESSLLGIHRDVT